MRALRDLRRGTGSGVRGEQRPSELRGRWEHVWRRSHARGVCIVARLVFSLQLHTLLTNHPPFNHYSPLCSLKGSRVSRGAARAVTSLSQLSPHSHRPTAACGTRTARQHHVHHSIICYSFLHQTSSFLSDAVASRKLSPGVPTGTRKGMSTTEHSWQSVCT